MIMGFTGRIIRAVVIGCAMTVTLAAQPSLPPNPGKGERSDNDSRRSEESRRAAEAAKAANITKKTVTSKSRTAEIRGFSFSDAAARGNRPLVIKSGNDAKVREQLKEDLLVMCRIIEKAAQPHISDVHKAAGIDLLALGGANRTVRTMYLEDYGVIFTLNVRIPLLSDAKAEEPEVKEATQNEEWEETRNELFGQKRRIKRIAPGHESYDEEDVKELKNELLDALVNAANIRNLKVNDWITVVVSGPGLVETEVIQVERGRGEGEKGSPARVEFSPRAEFFITEDGQSGGESSMVLRIRKGTLDEVVRKGGAADEVQKAVEAAANVQIY
jgi:hypothetical protein